LKNFSALLAAHDGDITVVSVTDGFGGEQKEDSVTADFSLSAGRTVRGDYAIYPNSLLFEAGDYPDKGFAITPEELAAAAAASGPVPFNIEHSSAGAHAATEGLFGGILRQWIDPEDPKRLRGEVAIPLPLDEKLATKAPSLEFARDTKKIVGAALTYKPRVSEAALMSAAITFSEAHFAFSETHFANTRHNTPEGQMAIQNIHDTAARAGAVCDRTNTAISNTAAMSSQHEATTIQKIHDLAADHGATCSKGDAPVWAKLAFSQSACPKPASPKSAKGEKSMSLKDTLKALFSSAGVPDADIEAHLTSEAVAEFSAPAPGMNETEKAQFSALVADNARLKAVAIAKDAAAFADKAVADNRAYPAERASLIALFTQAAHDDAVSPATVTFSTAKDAAGKETPITGSRVEALTFAVGSRPAHGLTSEQIQTAAFSGGTVLTPRTGTDEAEKINDQVNRLLASTDVGRKIASDKAKG